MAITETEMPEEQVAKMLQQLLDLKNYLKSDSTDGQQQQFVIF
jgi:hypothetical protein